MASDPHVRDVGAVDDIDGMRLRVGVDHDTVTVTIGCALLTFRLSRDATEELARLIVAAAWEAGDHAGRQASQL